MAAAKKRTRITKVPEGHTVAHHERLRCVKCPREFFGACAWDAHYPCAESNWRKVNNETWAVTPKGKEETMIKHVAGGPYVLLDEWDDFMAKQAQVAKAQAARTKNP